MKKKSVFDSFALLAYLKKESRFDKVKSLLSAEDIQIMINDINLGEIYYILARERGTVQADYFIQTIFPTLPINRISSGLEEVLEAARIKAQYSLSYADCFAVMTAKKENARLVTGDPEFKKVEKLIKIDWL